MKKIFITFILLVASFWTEKVTLSDTLWTIPETGIPVLKIAE